MAVVYIHRKATDGEIFYVGISKHNTMKRPNSISTRNYRWKNIYKKHGRIVDIVCQNISMENAVQIEIFLIAHYGRLDNKTGILSNLTDGGQGALGADWAKGNKYRLGKKHTEETKKKISEFSKGRKHTEETKRKIGLSSKGNKNNLGVKVSIKSKLKMSKPVAKCDLEGNIIEKYFGVREAQNITEVDRSSIIRVCKGVQKVAGGFKWIYMTKEEYAGS